MRPATEREIFEPLERRDRFDLDTVRGILERAAVEQYRLDSVRQDTYTREELEEMAAEAGISREALARTLRDEDGRSPGRRGRLRTGRSRKLLGVAVAIAGAIGLVGAMIAFPPLANFLFWTIIAFLVLILLGAAPV